MNSLHILVSLYNSIVRLVILLSRVQVVVIAFPNAQPHQYI